MIGTAFTIGPHQEEWLKALESGKYPQGSEYLHLYGEYCCLGVGAELTPGVECKEDAAGVTLFDGESADAPMATRRWLALRDGVGSFAGPMVSCRSNLTELNDEVAMPFAEIAALIRSRPQDFFTEPR